MRAIIIPAALLFALAWEGPGSTVVSAMGEQEARIGVSVMVVSSCQIQLKIGGPAPLRSTLPTGTSPGGLRLACGHEAAPLAVAVHRRAAHVRADAHALGARDFARVHDTSRRFVAFPSATLAVMPSLSESQDDGSIILSIDF